MGLITFNGKSSADYGILVEHPPGYHIPERDYEYIHVPGRNGDLIIDKGSYQNGRRKYEIAFGSINGDYATMANQVVQWLHSVSGYARLEDSYEPDYYRLASYVDEVDIENILFHAGRAEIEFNCKPQRYLKSGDTITTINSPSTGGTITNPTSFTSLPLIRLYTPSGTAQTEQSVTINGTVVVTITTIAAPNNPVVIDSDIQDAYQNGVSRNNRIGLPAGYFPKLLPGANTIQASSGISKIEIIPRWWTL